MADARSLRLIGYGLSMLTIIVSLIATMLVVEATAPHPEIPTNFVEAR